MASGLSTFGDLGSRSHVFAIWVSLTEKYGGSFKVSIFMQYWFLGANGSPIILL